MRKLMTGVIHPPWHPEDREKLLSLVLRLAEQTHLLHLSYLPGVGVTGTLRKGEIFL